MNFEEKDVLIFRVVATKENIESDWVDIYKNYIENLNLLKSNEFWLNFGFIQENYENFKNCIYEITKAGYSIYLLKKLKKLTAKNKISEKNYYKFFVLDIDNIPEKDIYTVFNDIYYFLETIKLRPALAVYTGGGLHIWFYLDEALNEKNYKKFLVNLKNLLEDFNLDNLDLHATLHNDNIRFPLGYNPKYDKEIKVIFEDKTNPVVFTEVYKEITPVNINLNKKIEIQTDKDAIIAKLMPVIRQNYIEKYRQKIVFHLAGSLRKWGFTQQEVENIYKTWLQELDGKEAVQRLGAIQTTFNKPINIVATLNTLVKIYHFDWLKETLEELREVFEKNYFVFEGKKYLIPEGWKLTKDSLGFYRMDKDLGEIYVEITKYPCFIEKVLCNEKNNAKYYVLRYKDINENDFKHLLLPGSALYTQNFIKYAGDYIVVGNYITKLVDFLTKFINLNRTNDLIETDEYYTQLGWKTKKNLSFLYGKTLLIAKDKDELIQKDASMQLAPDLLQRYNLDVAGDQEMQLKLIKKAVKICEKYEAFDILFSFYGAFTSFFLKELELFSFLIHFRTESSQGKTMVLRSIASLFGNPSKLLLNFTDTFAYFDRVFASSIGTPIFIDESSTADDKTKLDKWVYMFSQNKSKGKAKGGGSDVQDRFEWYHIGLATGESSLVSGSKSGSEIRIITLQSKFLEVFPAYIQDFWIEYAIRHAEKNYGYVGFYIMQNLIKYNRLYFRKIRKYFHEYKRKLNAKAKHALDKKFNTMLAAILATKSIVNEILNIEFNIIDKYIDDIFYEYIKDMNKKQTIGEKAYDLISQYVIQNIRNFGKVIEEYKETPQGNNYFGELLVKKKDDDKIYVYILTRIVKELLQKNGIDFTVVFEEWTKNENVIKIDKIHRLQTLEDLQPIQRVVGIILQNNNYNVEKLNLPNIPVE